MQSESVRMKAIRYINELKDGDDGFRPYEKERGKMGHLIARGHRSQNSLHLRSQLQPLKIVRRSSEARSIVSNKRTQDKNSNLDLSSICSLDEPTLEEQIKAQQYKDNQEKKALLKMLKNKKDINQNPYISTLLENANRSEFAPQISNDRFQWNMNNVDKGRNLTYLFSEPMLKFKKKKKPFKLESSSPDYEPKYDAVLPKPYSFKILPKQEKHTRPRQSESCECFLKVNRQKSQETVIASKEVTMEQMYNDIINQINNQVKQSLIKDPEKWNILDKFSAQPFDEKYLQDFKRLVRVKIKETAVQKKRGQEKVHEIIFGEKEDEID